MIRYTVLAIAFALATSSEMGTEMCTPIAFRPEGGSVIETSGRYCLDRDLKIGGRRSWGWEGPAYLSDDIIALVIAAHDVSIDLKGYKVSSHAREVRAGVQTALVNTGESTEFSKSSYGYRKASWDAAYRNITIRNGTIRLKHFGFGTMFVGSAESFSWGIAGLHLGRIDVPMRGCGDEITYEPLTPPTAQAYPIRNITLEKLKIQSLSCGVFVQGANTVIRNSVIETDSQTGLWLFGPNAVIENNTIIVNEFSKDSRDKVREHDAPIRLRQADNSIVRNNRIIYRARLFSSTKGAVAIDLQDSKNVLFENNTIEGILALSRIDSKSMLVARQNKSSE